MRDTRAKARWSLDLAAPPAKVREALARTGAPQPFSFGSMLEPRSARTHR